jgi:hypothetical protein
MIKVQTTLGASPRNHLDLQRLLFGGEGFVFSGLGEGGIEARSPRSSISGIVRANSFTLPKRQNRISRPLIFLDFSGSI